MVLHKSKWDSKAKHKYMKKHGIVQAEAPKPVKAKWSAKKTSNTPKYLDFDDDDSDWDSEDEALLEHFYPQLGETQMPNESKLAIKRQIVHALRQHQNQEEPEPEKREFNEEDGIYLGTRHEKAEEIPEEGELEIDEEAAKYLMPKDQLESKIAEFLSSDFRPQKNRKLLKSKMSDNLLDEYGIESYTSTVKDSDYSKGDEEQLWKDFDKFTAEDLHGFQIGGKLNKSNKGGIRELTDEEKQQHSNRSEKLESAKLHEQIKKKFGVSASQAQKIIEVNNINENDERAMGVLNKKIAQSSPENVNTLEDDLETLLGGGTTKAKEEVKKEDDLDELLEQLDAVKVEEKAPKAKGKISKQDESFLDDLLG